MTLYANFFVHLATTSFAILPGLAAAYIITRWCPLAPLAKVWILRLVLLTALVAFFGLGVPIAVAAGSREGTPVNLRGLSIGIGIYAAGVLFCASELLSDLRAVARMRRHTVACPRETQRVADAIAAAMGLRRSPPVRRASAGESVVLVAGRPATIVLPGALMDEETLRLALAHEMAHVRHRDLTWAGVAALTRCLLWFHPGVHVAVRRLGAFQETAADHAALRDTAAPKRQYAEMLIGVATARKQVPMVGATAASVREDVEERLRSLYAPVPRRWALPLAVAVVALTAVPLKPTPKAKPNAMKVFAPVQIAAPVGG